MNIVKKAATSVFVVCFLGYGIPVKAQHPKMDQMPHMHPMLSPAGITEGNAPMPHMWMFSYGYMHTLSENNISGTIPVQDSDIFRQYIMVPRQMDMKMHMLMGMYGISEKLSVMVMLQLPVMNMHMNMITGVMEMSSSDIMTTASAQMLCKSYGIGDTKISFGYNWLSDQRHHLVFNVGLSLPTGRITVTDAWNMMLYGQRQSYMMQCGSGTFDILPGLTWTWNGKKFAWSVQSTGVIHPYKNSAGYRLGNTYNLTTWSALHWIQWFSSSLRLAASYAGHIHGIDTQIFPYNEPDSNPVNYGGIILTGLVGINYYFKDDLLQNSKVAVEYGLPLYQNLKGIQLASKQSLNITWFMSF